MSIDDTSHFTKQRRNLIIISSVVLLHDILGIKYEDFEPFGMKITKTENINWIIWLVWGYFLVRFCNLFFETESTLIKPINKLFLNKMKPRIIESYEKSGPTVNKVTPILNNSAFKIEYLLDYNIEGIGDDKITLDKFDLKETLENENLFKYKISSIFDYIFKTHYFFEYYFPILFAFSPVIFYLGVLASWW